MRSRPSCTASMVLSARSRSAPSRQSKAHGARPAAALVARVAIAPEAPGDGGEGRVASVAGQPIAAGRQRLRELPDQQLGRARRLAGRAIAQAEEDAGNAAVESGKQRLLLGRALEADAFDPCALLRRQRQRLERGVLVHRPDRDLLTGGPVGNEDVVDGKLVALHRVVAHLRVLAAGKP